MSNRLTEIQTDIFADRTGNVVVRRRPSGWILELDDALVMRSKFKDKILSEGELMAKRLFG